MEPTEFLEKIYNESMAVVGSDNEIKSDLDSTIANHLLEILGRSESAKAVITVILTSSVYKKLNPDQDIRNHQKYSRLPRNCKRLDKFPKVLFTTSF